MIQMPVLVPVDHRRAGGVAGNLAGVHGAHVLEHHLAGLDRRTVKKNVVGNREA